MDAGIAGAIIGSTFGILGGIVGTVFSVKNTKGPRERQFMMRVAIGTWLGVTLFLVLLLLLPSPYRWLMWIPYGIVLPLAIISLNRKQRAIRSAEQNPHP